MDNRKKGFLNRMLSKKDTLADGGDSASVSIEPAVFSDEFVLDSVRISRKELRAYIKGKSAAVLGEEFYYGYRYHDGLLSFIALKSNSYLVGKLPLFYPALMTEGKFSYKKQDAESYYYLTNTNGFCSVEVGYEKQPGYLPIEELVIASIPESMKLTWSLKGKNLHLNLILAILLYLSATFFIISSKDYDAARMEQQAIAKHSPVVPRGLPSFINSVADMGNKVEGKGYIRKVTLANGRLSYTIKFKQDADAQVFLKNHGGTYERDKIVFTTALSAAR